MVAFANADHLERCRVDLASTEAWDVKVGEQPSPKLDSSGNDFRKLNGGAVMKIHRWNNYRTYRR